MFGAKLIRQHCQCAHARRMVILHLIAKFPFITQSKYKRLLITLNKYEE